MQITENVKQILSYYSAENIGVKTNLARILSHGQLSGSGKILIYAVDQGFEHGPCKSFAINPNSYDPEYHFELARQSGVSAYAAPLGSLEFAADKFVGQVPMILKLNSSIALSSKELSPYQAMSASITDALRLGCCAVGISIYPGSNSFYDMLEQAKEVILEAKSYGLAVVVWSYPRGQGVSKEGQTAIDVCCYAGHIAALIGANIIKLKPPSNFIEDDTVLELYQNGCIQTATLEQRVRHVMHSVFNHKRLVIFSGLAIRDDQDLINDIIMIKHAGASGSIIGRNIFQRQFDESIQLINKVCQIYKANV